MEARIEWNWAGLRGIIQNKRKFIYCPEPEFYDLNADPKELNNLYASNPDLAREMKTTMYKIEDQWPPMSTGNPERVITPEEIAQLKSLGYFTGGTAPQSNQDLEKIEGLPDLKDKANVVDKAAIIKEEADGAFDTGDYHTAKKKYTELFQYAEVVLAVQNMGEIASYEQNETDAIKYMRRATELAPDAVKSWYNLGVVYHTFKNNDEAEKAFTKALEINPSDPINVDSFVGLALCESDKSNWQGALDHILAARSMDSGRRELIGYEASIRYQMVKADEADANVVKNRIGDGDKALAGDTPDAKQYRELTTRESMEIKQSYDLYTKFLSSGPGSVADYYEAGQVAILMQDYANALDWTISARNLTPEDDPNRAGLDQLVARLQGMVGGGQTDSNGNVQGNK